MREGGRVRERGKELGRKESGREESEGGMSEEKKNGGKDWIVVTDWVFLKCLLVH